MPLKCDCPTCGSSTARPWRTQGAYTVVRCDGCSLGITWPPPSDEQLAEFYSTDYYVRHEMDASSAGWAGRAESIIQRIPAEVRRVLDIGAGQGHFVAALRSNGLCADGVEPLEEGRRVAQVTYGLNLLEAWPTLGGEPYDLVSLIHSLEHVREPLSVLKEAARRVGTDGYLFVDVPHAASIELIRPVRRRQILALPGHLFHFTPRSLTALLERAGWETQAVYVLNPDLLEWLLARRAPVTPTLRPPALADAAGPRAGADADRTSRGGVPLVARIWRRVLPGLRERFPGYRFETVARLRPSQASGDST